MRKINLSKIITVIILSCCVAGMLTSCRYAKRYTDDAVRYIDDKIDNGIKYKSKGIRNIPEQKSCPDCYGSGIVYDAYGNGYECPNCGGDGKVWSK